MTLNVACFLKVSRLGKIVAAAIRGLTHWVCGIACRGLCAGIVNKAGLGIVLKRQHIGGCARGAFRFEHAGFYRGATAISADIGLGTFRQIVTNTQIIIDLLASDKADWIGSRHINRCHLDTWGILKIEIGQAQWVVQHTQPKIKP